MNAIVGDLRWGSTHDRFDEHSKTPEVLELLARALMLVIPPDQAIRALGDSLQGRRLSLIYRELAERELWRLKRRVGTPAGPRQGLAQPLAQLSELSRHPERVTSTRLAGIIFRIVAGCSVPDRLLLRRVLVDVDSIAFRHLRLALDR